MFSAKRGLVDFSSTTFAKRLDATTDLDFDLDRQKREAIDFHRSRETDSGIIFLFEFVVTAASDEAKSRLDP